MYWKIATLLILFIFFLWCFVEVKIRTKKDDDIEEAFWERERKANMVRRKPIDHLDYIKVPSDLPVDLLPDNPEIPGIIETVERISGDKVLNLTGYTNTDLKLMYGAPNITELSLYDQNYTALVTTMQKWADILLDNDHEEEAVKIMEFLISTKADIGRTYRLLGKYYLAHGRNDAFDELKKTASELKSLNGPHILKSLEEMG
ncbi:MAG: hypothetical protein K6E32_04405 [Lachnospiraceae bacterium]|nr:hypothetical protein [Lachnospiraceae bacterium]